MATINSTFLFTGHAMIRVQIFKIILHLIWKETSYSPWRPHPRY